MDNYVPRGTLQNRPYGVTSKPANEADPEHMMLYRAGDGSGKYFFSARWSRGYTDSTWAEGTATQGCDRSADPGAGMTGRVSRPAMAILARKR